MVVREHYLVAKPDNALRSCLPRPAKPKLESDIDVSLLIVDLDEWGKDCEAKLKKTWQSIDAAVKDAIDQNKKAANP